MSWSSALDTVTSMAPFRVATLRANWPVPASFVVPSVPVVLPLGVLSVPPVGVLSPVVLSALPVGVLPPVVLSVGVLPPAVLSVLPGSVAGTRVRSAACGTVSVPSPAPPSSALPLSPTALSTVCFAASSAAFFRASSSAAFFRASSSAAFFRASSSAAFRTASSSMISYSRETALTAAAASLSA